MGPIIIAVIGAPGVGKSFLVEKLARQLNAEPIFEDVSEIPDKIISNFKNNQGQVETILWFRNYCIQKMERALNLKKEGKTVVMDTAPISNELYIPAMTSGFEKEVLLMQAYLDKKYIPKPDVFIFLDASESKTKEMILKRNRDFEITEEFMQRNLNIRRAHSDYYNRFKSDFIYINRDGLDFNKNDDLQKVLAEIKSFIDSMTIV